MRRLRVRRALGGTTRSPFVLSLAEPALAFVAFASTFSGCHRGSLCPEGTRPSGTAVSLASGTLRADEGSWQLCEGEAGAVSYAVRVSKGGVRREQCPEIGTKLDGTYLSRHDNGTLFLRGEYRDGQKQGRWEQWGPDGAQVATGSYRDGRLVSGAPVGAPAACERLEFRR